MSPGSTGTVGAVVESRVSVFVCVGPVRPDKRGSSNNAVGAMAGAVTVGAIGVTGARGVIGKTVTWIIDSVGLKKMVSVAAACLINGLGRLIGDSRGRDAAGDNPERKKGMSGGGGKKG